MPYESEHAVRVLDPDKFQQESFRRRNIATGIDIIIGKLKGESKMTLPKRRESNGTCVKRSVNAQTRSQVLPFSAFVLLSEPGFHPHAVLILLPMGLLSPRSQLPFILGLLF